MAQHWVGDAARLAYEVDQLEGRGPVAPQDTAARQRHPLVGKRHLGECPAPVLLADEVLGGDTHLVEEDLVERVQPCHLDDGSDLDAGQVHGTDEVGNALVFGGLGIGAGDEDAEAGHVGERCPDLLPVDDVDVAVAHGPRREVREVGPGARLAEQLAPHLLAGQHRQQVPLLLGLASRVEQRWARPADPDGVHRPRHARPA